MIPDCTVVNEPLSKSKDPSIFTEPDTLVEPVILVSLFNSVVPEPPPFIVKFVLSLTVRPPLLKSILPLLNPKLP